MHLSTVCSAAWCCARSLRIACRALVTNFSPRRAAQAKQRKRSFQSRPIQHPRFANVLVTRARAALLSETFDGLDRLRDALRPSGPADGDALFHPSPKGPTRLSLTIRLVSVPPASGVDPQPLVQNLDLVETKRPGAGAHLTLGTPLRVAHLYDHLDAADCEFEDLDEVCDNQAAVPPPRPVSTLRLCPKTPLRASGGRGGGLLQSRATLRC
jgi:SH2 domain